MDYAAMCLNIGAQFYTSNMVLAINSDATYLAMSNERSRVAGYFQSNAYSNNMKDPDVNRAILIEFKAL